jgi:hypothetical protein
MKIEKGGEKIYFLSKIFIFIFGYKKEDMLWERELVSN